MIYFSYITSDNSCDLKHTKILTQFHVENLFALLEFWKLVHNIFHASELTLWNYLKFEEGFLSLQLNLTF